MRLAPSPDSLVLKPHFWLAATVASIAVLGWYLVGPVGMWSGNSTPVVEPDYGLIPLVFEANIGQSNEEVAYLARGNGYALFLAPQEAGMVVWTAEEDSEGRLQAGEAAAFNMQFVNANPNPTITPVDRQDGRVSYLLGEEESDWYSDIDTYSKVQYEGLYPGIDLIFYGNGRQLEYDFVIAPDADPSRIRLRFEGVNGLSLDDNGNLVLQTAAGEVLQKAPVSFQEVRGKQVPVESEFVLFDNNEVGFAVGAYDLGRPLIIDPIVYSTFLGGNYFDLAYDVAVDSAGAAYMTGIVSSPDFPVVPGGYSIASPNGFVAKVNPTGTALEYTAFIAGNGHSIDLDEQGSAYVGGIEYSGFALKIDPTGSTLVYKTMLASEVLGVAVGQNGHLFVTGESEGTMDFTPTPGAFQETYGGWYSDAFVARLDESGGIVYGSFLGGEYDEYGRAAN